jgi:hypothetical protein
VAGSLGVCWPRDADDIARCSGAEWREHHDSVGVWSSCTEVICCSGGVGRGWCGCGVA